MISRWEISSEQKMLVAGWPPWQGKFPVLLVIRGAR